MTDLDDRSANPIDEAAVRQVLHDRWDVGDPALTPVRGGVNSQVWRVRCNDLTAAVRVVPARQQASLRAGAMAAKANGPHISCGARLV